jgi:hypothetical protein
MDEFYNPAWNPDDPCGMSMKVTFYAPPPKGYGVDRHGLTVVMSPPKGKVGYGLGWKHVVGACAWAAEHSPNFRAALLRVILPHLTTDEYVKVIDTSNEGLRRLAQKTETVRRAKPL